MLERPLRRAVDGVLLLDKPEGWSSTNALGKAKFLLLAEKGGHTGTLDPFATGLLPLCFGEATKFARFLLDADKSYRATLYLGATSSSGDTEGVISRNDFFDPARMTKEEIERALGQFLGAQTQIPPMHSAIKIDGVPLYKLARRGEEVPREARAITVSALTLVEWSPAEHRLVIDASVSKGTYLRVLAEDIGRALGAGAYLTALRRTIGGGFRLEQSVSIEALEAMSMTERESCLLAPEALCQGLPKVEVGATEAIAFGHGQVVCHGDAGRLGECRVVDASGRFLGVALSTTDPHRGATLTPVRLMRVAQNLPASQLQKP